jgi:hypothetical protein
VNKPATLKVQHMMTRTKKLDKNADIICSCSSSTLALLENICAIFLDSFAILISILFDIVKRSDMQNNFSINK